MNSGKAEKKSRAAVNVDDEYGKRLLAELPAGALGFGQRAAISGDGLKMDLTGIRGNIQADGVSIAITSPLLGGFNASNILGAVAAARALGFSGEVIGRGVAALDCVPGRLERVPNDKGIYVVVDYAHKPDALQKVLETLRQALAKGPGRLITVMGCGGDRDRTKRPVMGRMAVEQSDQVFITSDNPRTENPEAILLEIQAGIPASRTNFAVEPDRREAIHAAIRFARAGDLVVIAGKGHEDYQILADPSAPGGTRKIHFDDREVAAEALALR